MPLHLENSPVFDLLNPTANFGHTSMFRIKICGITRTEDAQSAVSLGADALGLNFYAAGKRYLPPLQAKSLIEEIRHRAQETRQSPPKFVGVFVNHSLQQILEIHRPLRLDILQLHGDETIEFASHLAQALANEQSASTSATTSDASIMRAIRFSDSSSTNQLQDAQQQIERWRTAGVTGILLDAAVPGQYGGTGHQVDWEFVRQLANQVNLPLVLAGGLRAENIKAAIQTTGIGSVDVASGVETEPGIKDQDKMKRFIQSALSQLESN